MQLLMTEEQVAQDVAVFGKYPVMQKVQFIEYPPVCRQLTQLATWLEHSTQLDPLAVK